MARKLHTYSWERLDGLLIAQGFDPLEAAMAARDEIVRFYESGRISQTTFEAWSKHLTDVQGRLLFSTTHPSRQAVFFPKGEAHGG